MTTCDEAHEERIDRLQERIIELRETIDERDKAITALNEEIHELETTIQELRGEKEGHQDREKELDERVDKAIDILTGRG